MGDPRKQRKKYQTPAHPWQAERIKEEREILKTYGLKNKKELWKMGSKISKFKLQAKKLIGQKGEQAEGEKKQFLDKLAKMKLIDSGAQLDHVLELTTKEILERRLQTQVLRKGFAKSAKQARQFIVHGHVFVNEKKINVPSYLINNEEENLVSFNPSSNLADEEHPERIVKLKEVKQVVKEVEEITKQEKLKKEVKTEEISKEEKK
ncbi:MAG: 30S ribosomal protein S4 [archaeon]